jgi:hypothetical protein
MSHLSVPNFKFADCGDSRGMKIGPALAASVLAHLSNRINDTEIGFPAVT